MTVSQSGFMFLAASVILMAAAATNRRPVFGQNSQDPRNNESRPAGQDPAAQEPAAQDRDRRQEKTPQNSPEEYQPITLAEGTVIPVRIADNVDSNHDKAGALFTGTVDPSVLINDIVVIPRGTEAHIRMVEAKKGGHIEGKAKVRLELVSLIMNGQRLGVDSNAPSKTKGAAQAKTSAAAKKGQGAGGVLTGDPGAAAGPVIAAFSAAKVEVKAGSRIEFRLEAPFTFEKPPMNTTEQH
jgi:hypothetical protein